MSVVNFKNNNCSGKNNPEQLLEECPYAEAIKHYSWYYFFNLKLEKKAQFNIKDSKYFYEKRKYYGDLIKAVKFARDTGCSFKEAKEVFSITRSKKNGS